MTLEIQDSVTIEKGVGECLGCVVLTFNYEGKRQVLCPAEIDKMIKKSDL